jgi:hypothetical protein
MSIQTARELTRGPLQEATGLTMPAPRRLYKAGTVKVEAIAPEGKRKYYKLRWAEPETGATRTQYLRTADPQVAECARWNKEHSMGDEIYMRWVPHRKPRGRRRGRSMAKKTRPKAKGK